MSRRIFSQIQNYSKNFHRSPVLIAQKCQKSSNNENSGPQKPQNDQGSTKRLSQTTILVQQGCDIQELPVILRKMSSDEFVTICTTDVLKDQHKMLTTTNNEIEVHADLVIQQLSNCMTSTGILSIIDQIPEDTLCPEIAAHAFDRLIRNETLISLKNLEDSSPVFEKLINSILKKCDPKTLLDFMEVLKTFLDLQRTVQRFCDELLLRNSDGILNCIEISECIERFVDCKQFTAAEKFWTGISDQEKSIDAQNIKFIFKILPKLKVSRRLVVGVIERRIAQVWWNLKSEAVVESVQALATIDLAPVRTMQSFSRWLNTNIHAISELHLGLIIKSMTKLDFSNSEVEKTLERYMKSKGIKIKSPDLVTEILQHSIHFRLRNHYILNGASEYFICHSEKVHPTQIRTIMQAYGFLDFNPLNGVKFWQVVEQYLNENFTKISAQDLIEIFLNCCYLEMYPLNFVSSIFNPDFLDQMHASTAPEHITKVRTDLKLLDATLTLEAESYSGPMLPKDHSAKSIWQDGRIKRMVNLISDHFEKLVGSSEQFTKSVIMAKLPTNSLYIIDVLVHPPGFKIFYSLKNDRNVLIAILVLIPDYYDSKGKFLIGPQKMRIRHLRKLGMKVVTLNHEDLAKLRLYPVQLEKYLIEKMKEALPALPLN